MLRGQAITITFFAIDSSAPPARRAGLTFIAGDCKIWNGTTFTNTGSQPAEVGSTGRYTLALTAAETNQAWQHVFVEKTGMQPQDVVCEAGHGPPAHAVVADGGNSATSFVTNLTSAVTDFYKDALVRFTSGALAGQVKKVTGYNGATKALSFTTGFTSAPGTDDLFALVTI